MLIEYIDSGPGILQPIEHLNALRLPHWQNLGQIQLLQGVGIQMQRAVFAAFFAQIVRNSAVTLKRYQAHCTGLQLQNVSVLLNLQQITEVEVLRQQRLGIEKNFFDPQGYGLGSVMTEAVHPQPWLVAGITRTIEVVAQAPQQGMFAIVAVHLNLVPAIECYLVQGQDQVFTYAGVAQGVGTFGGHQDVQVTMVA
ncbi:hypothetical protein D3C77_504530 [compost metagenome]